MTVISRRNAVRMGAALGVPAALLATATRPALAAETTGGPRIAFGDDAAFLTVKHLHPGETIEVAFSRGETVLSTATVGPSNHVPDRFAAQPRASDFLSPPAGADNISLHGGLQKAAVNKDLLVDIFGGLSSGSLGSGSLLPPASSPTINFWGLPIVTRQGWGADEAATTWQGGDAYPVQAITVHHTVGPRGDETLDYASLVRSIHYSHAVANGWGDIGYHLIIDPAGTIYAGKSTGNPTLPIFDISGALPNPAAKVISGGHVANGNNGNIGICLIGNFENMYPTPAALGALRQALDALTAGLRLNRTERFQYVNPEGGGTANVPRVGGHRDWAALAGGTACPGGNLYGFVPWP